MMANFGSSSVTVIRINDDGSLGQQTAFMKHIGHGRDASFQYKAHPHSIDVSPDNRFAVVSDLGVDKVFVYKFDEKTGTLSPDDPPFVEAESGGGPRHFVFDAAGKFGYSLHEMSGLRDRNGMGFRDWKFHQSAGCQDAGTGFYWRERQR